MEVSLGISVAGLIVGCPFCTSVRQKRRFFLWYHEFLLCQRAEVEAAKISGLSLVSHIEDSNSLVMLANPSIKAITACVRLIALICEPWNLPRISIPSPTHIGFKKPLPSENRLYINISAEYVYLARICLREDTAGWHIPLHPRCSMHFLPAYDPRLEFSFPLTSVQWLQIYTTNKHLLSPCLGPVTKQQISSMWYMPKIPPNVLDWHCNTGETL